MFRHPRWKGELIQLAGFRIKQPCNRTPFHVLMVSGIRNEDADRTLGATRSPIEASKVVTSAPTLSEQVLGHGVEDFLRRHD
jgi:hypothetical protein